MYEKIKTQKIKDKCLYLNIILLDWGGGLRIFVIK